MYLCGFPKHIEWVCEKCFKKTDNYGTDLRKQIIYINIVEWE